MSIKKIIFKDFHNTIFKDFIKYSINWKYSVIFSDTYVFKKKNCKENYYVTYPNIIDILSDIYDLNAGLRFWHFKQVYLMCFKIKYVLLSFCKSNSFIVKVNINIEEFSPKI